MLQKFCFNKRCRIVGINSCVQLIDSGVIDSHSSARTVFHLIAPSALVKTRCGIVMLICFAVFRFITKSRFLGLSISKMG
jgi:hypothetical protein